MPTLADVLRNYTPPTESALADPIKEHFRTLPQKFATNQAEQMALLGQAFPGNTYKSMMTEGDPKAMAELAMQVPFNALTAYHGTPHKIVGKFDINKVGTGEGAQAYGHGMYFAENPAVATEYKNILSKPEFTKNAEGTKLRGELPRMLEESYSELTAKNGIQQTNYGDVADVVGERLNRQMKDALKANDMDWYNKVADMKLDLARFKENPPPNKGNLYKVDIPDEQIPNMLDWDKPLKDQTKILEGILSKNSGFTGQTKREIQELVNKNATGGELFELFGKDQKELADELAKLGVPGVRYLDQGSRGTVGGEVLDVFKTPEGWKSKIKVTNRGGVGFQDPTDVFTTSMPFKTEAEAKKWANEKIASGSSNFVVFDPSTVKILEENSKPLSRKELIEQQVNKVLE